MIAENILFLHAMTGWDIPLELLNVKLFTNSNVNQKMVYVSVSSLNNLSYISYKKLVFI